MAKRSAKAKIALRITSSVLHILLNVLFYILVVFFVVRISTGAFDFSYQLFGDVSVDPVPGVEREIVVTEGESTMTLATQLELKKLIVDKYSFYTRAKLTGELIKPGTYVLNSSMNYEDILLILTQQDTTSDEDY